MKRWYFIILLCWLVSFNPHLTAGNGSLKITPVVLATGKSEVFAGTWKGNEQCQAVSAPVAILVITTDGPNQVFITGMYSLQGKIRGVVKGNTITIPRQTVDDPKFKNVAVEGSLTIGSNYKALTGVLAVLNNDTRDACTVNYHR
jgi:hypothetical protein